LSTRSANVPDHLGGTPNRVAFVRGVRLLVAGGLLGAAYDQGVALAVGLILSANIAALAGLALVLRRDQRRG
jgi:hypothetical protein